jgi:hypothetical protein
MNAVKEEKKREGNEGSYLYDWESRDCGNGKQFFRLPQQRRYFGAFTIHTHFSIDF